MKSSFRKSRWPLQEVAAIVTVALVIGGLYTALTWHDSTDEPATTGLESPRGSATITGPTGLAVAPRADGLPVVALEGLATSVAQAVEAKDFERANALIAQARQLTGCSIQGFTGGPVIEGKPYLQDLSDPRTQGYIHFDAAEHGLEVGFGHSHRVWIVVAQNCGAAS